MTGFEQFDETALEIEHEMSIKAVVLGIDWNNPQQIRELAHEALSYSKGELGSLMQNEPDAQTRAKVEFFALAGLMLKTMQTSAEAGVDTHGGVVWKTFGRALFEVAGMSRAPR